VNDPQITPTADKALTFTRVKGLSVRAARSPQEVLARPTSLHGAAVACKRLGTKYGDLVVFLDGRPLTACEKAMLKGTKWEGMLPE